MLELQSISKRLGSFAISDISINIEDGEYFILLGPSGVGKSVLVEIIAGLIKPDKGRIRWDCRDITSLQPQSRGFAVVYQDYALFPHLTVRQNIAYGLKATRIPSKEITNRIDTLADTLHIGQLLTRKPSTLSGGEQQRVALARALAVEPRLLLLDEPLSALDTNIRLKLQNELKRINRELNISVLHVTHNPQEAMKLGDRICVMLDNKIRQIAEPTQLFRKPSDAKVAGFLAMSNVFAVTDAKDGCCSIFGHNIYASSVNDSTSHIWIKPEEILLSKEPFDSSARNQFKAQVTDLDHRDTLLAVHLTSGKLTLTALITYASFKKLGIEIGSELYATFKSSAVHCF